MSHFNNINTNLSGETSTQKAYTIGGVPILFPHKAYPSQITMMDKIIKCLNKRHNCLLESPTGSGKSLALLCSTLGWLKKTDKQMREMEQLLENHLNAHGVTVADNVHSGTKTFSASVSDFEKYRFHTNRNPIKSESLESATVNQKPVFESTPSKYFDGCFSSKENCMNSSCVSESPRPSTCSEIAFEGEKKRGIIYLDDDDDLDDFQTFKKSKFFSPKKTSLCSSNLQENLTNEYISSKEDVKAPESLKQTEPDHACIAKTKILENSGNNTLPTKLPKIYFGTRTHKQIAQIIRELRKTPYKDIKMTILSSRERSCIHPKNCKALNKNEGCDELINRDHGPACDFYKNVKKFCYSHPPELSTAFDLEDFVSICRRKRICPYFGARELLTHAEIVFCPYNYLVDPVIRDALSINLKDSIIIMDEAHNIEDSAREAANRTISVSQLQEALADVLQIGQLKRETSDSEHYMHIAKVLENLKKWLEGSHNLNEYVTFDSSAKVWSGDDMIAVLDYVGLGPDTFPIFQNKYAHILREESEIDKSRPDEFDVPKLSGSTHFCIRGLTETLNYMFKKNLSYIPDFRLVLKKAKSYSNETSLIPASQAFKRKSFSNVFEITVNFWCLNPAVVFSDMKDVIHSLIVASGTLAPLDSFQSELGLPFQITLEANHVVSKEQMWVGTIGRGPSNNCLNGTFHSASTFTYQDDVGNLVLEVSSVIPHGILCFFPSYSMLDKLASRWQLTGLWGKLLCKKVVLCEPRKANDNFQQIIQEFYDAVEESETNVDGTINGALLLAVCRGKVSEGLDFADNNARAVITVGIPFPNVKDAQVDLKKKYNDIYSSKRPIVTGSHWYEMQAFRALNQALGRCIRHRNDYGALIIVDERFQKNNRYVGALSKWIRKEVEHFNTFYDALNSLNCFSEKMSLKDNSKTD